ncbi:hypothetical protein LTR62_003655 [Meristemomyces frigidus]|uniref:G-protein coupled receptors family 2 profile 2 domain-containing protein n=1 Tax=Meristemomyces frigidus TaxID=1508187 RepID=A0AAN7TFA3_9PEZI|nr:hypothetical protein LTR62_003655 [Meristemomyces frigidus]
MSNETLRGACVAPFYDAAAFGRNGGFIQGRFCAPVTGLLPGNPTCCLPCPASDWAYSESFTTYNNIADWLNVVGLILLVFMLISYILLPAQKTRSHYLSVCLIVSVMMIALGFTIPLASHPDQCYDEITPSDMYSSTECAWSGAFIVAGGLSATMWIFIRALSMNLQICFDIVPGKKFFYVSQALGWGIPAALFAITLSVTGVSFRFGSACHVNHDTSMQDFWGPLLGFAGAAGILQLATFGYCINVYLKNLWTDQAQNSTHGSSSGLPSYNNSVRTQTARAVYQRLKKVLWLQWRGICIVTIILVDVIFFSIVFVDLDHLQASLSSDFTRVEPWLECLAFNPTDKTQCLPLVSDWLVNEPTVVAVLLLLSLAGLQVFLFLIRPSVLTGWIDLVRGRLSPNRQEFISLDARPDHMRTTPPMNHTTDTAPKYDHVRGHPSTVFEMQKPFSRTGEALDLGWKPPHDTILSSPSETYQNPLKKHHSDASSATDSPPLGAFRGIRPPEYVGRVTPEINAMANPSPPAVGYSSISANRRPGDYFSQYQQQPSYQQQQQQQQQQQRRPYPRQPFAEAGIQQQSPTSASESHPIAYPPLSRPTAAREGDSHERRYQAPRTSFSVPSRQSSTRSMGFGAAEAREAREGCGRGGLGLHPPPEMGESSEDLALEQRPLSLPRR